VRQETGFVETSSLEKPSTDSNFILVVNKWTAPLVPFSALSEFIVEHAVLLAPVLTLEDDVDTALLGLRQRLPRQGVPTSGENSRLEFVKLLASEINSFMSSRPRRG